MKQKPLNPYLYSFYDELRVNLDQTNYGVYDFIMSSRDAYNQDTFLHLIVKYDILIKLFNYYYLKDNGVAYGGDYTLYYFYMVSHKPFTTEFQKILNIRLRENKINKLLNY